MTGGGGVRMLRVPNFVNNYTIRCANSQNLYCWVRYFYTQGFTFIITETACMLILAFKINYNLGSTFNHFLQKFDLTAAKFCLM